MTNKKISADDLLNLLGITFGDYCHGYNWHDKNLNDPWAVGFLSEIKITEEGNVYFRLRGENVPFRLWRYCEKITAEEGNKLLGSI